MKQVFVIVKSGDLEPVWAGFETLENAEQRAILYSVHYGNVQLISGSDLGDLLRKEA